MIRTILALIFLPAALWAQEISVRGGSALTTVISDGDATPSTTDSTDFGTANVTGGSIEKTFRIRNVASDDGNAFTGNLVITSISENSSHFSITSAPIITLAEGQFGDLKIRFNPTSAGTNTATVTIRNNDSNEDPYTFAIRGIGQGFPEITVYGAPSVISNGTFVSDGDTTPSTTDGTAFGTVQALNLDVSHTFRVTNTGTAPLTLTATDDSSHFFVSGLNSSVGVNGADDFTVTYDPQTSGSHSATITLSNNDSNENPYTFRVNGTARAPEIAVAGGTGLNVNIVDGDSTPNTTDRTNFGSRDIGAGPTDRTFRIRNTETDDGNPLTGHLVISSITENSSQFSIVSGPIAPIPEGGFADFTVRFDPSSIATHNAVVTINNNDIDGNEDPFTFSIRGVGTGSPEIAVYGFPGATDGTFIGDGDTAPRVADGTFFGDVQVSGGSVTHTFRIRNSGSAPLTVSATEGSTSFSLSSVASPIPAGGFDDFNVIFNPTTTGTLTSTITITNNDPDGGENPYTFRVQGTGRAPEIAVAGGTNLDTNIADGDTTPTTSDRTDFGSLDLIAAPRDYTFRIRNTEFSDGNPLTGNLVISSITESSPHFSILTGPFVPIPEGGFFDFTVRFDPTVVGTHSTVITIDNNDPDGGEDPFTFTVRGIATGSPEIAVYGLPTPVTIGILVPSGDTTPRLLDGTDFSVADVHLGAVTHTFRIRNSGSAPLTVSATENSSQFSLTSLPSSVAPGGFDDFNINFDPSTTGLLEATITINHNDPDDGESPYTFRVQGFGRGPEIDVRGGQFLTTPIGHGDDTPRVDDHTDFGTLDLQDPPVDRVFRIINSEIDDGNPLTANLVVGTITVDSPHFSVVTGPALPIQELGVADVVIRFNPNAIGTHTATVSIPHNDPDDDESPYTFTIQGVGVGSPDISVFGAPGLLVDGLPILNGDNTPRTEDNTGFGTPDVNGPPTTKVFRIRNTGNVQLTTTVSERSSSFRIDNAPSQIPAGGFSDFNVIFDPRSSGRHTAIITIDSNDPDDKENPFTFVVSGDARAPEIAVFGGRTFDQEILHNDQSPRPEDGTLFAETEIGNSIEYTFRIDNLQRPDGLPLTGNLVISSIVAQTITPGEPNPFQIVSLPILSVEEGASALLTVRFTPFELGPVSADIIITHNDPDGAEAPFEYKISGIGVGEPEIRVFGSPPVTPIPDGFEILDGDDTPQRVDGTAFGNAALPVPAPTALSPGNRFRVRNPGVVPLTYDVTVRNIGAEEPGPNFGIFLNGSGTVPPGGFADFSVYFRAETSGLKRALVEIETNIPEAEPFSFEVQALATAPEIEVFGGDDFSVSILNLDFDPGEEDGTIFGDVPIGQTAERTFRIRNLEPDDDDPTTISPLIVKSISVLNNEGEFYVLPPVPNLLAPLPIGPEQFFDFTVQFRPVSVGAKVGGVHVSNNDPDDDESGYFFNVVGNGIPGGPEIEIFGGDDFSVSILNLDFDPGEEDGTIFGDVPIGQTAERTFRIRNLEPDDDDPTTISPLIVKSISVLNNEGEFYVLPPVPNLLAPLPIGPEQFFDFTVQFRPVSVGAKVGGVHVSNNDPDEDESGYFFNVVGNGIPGGPEIEVFGLPVPLISNGAPIDNGDDTPREEDGTDFGFADVHALLDRTHTFRVRNSGGAPLTVSINEDSAQFEITEPLNASIPPGQFDDFNITYNPQVSGRHDATVTIDHNDPDDNGAPYSFTITGRAYAPEIRVESAIPPSLEIANNDLTPTSNDGTEFGEVAVSGATAEHTFHLLNEVEPGGLPFTGNLIITEFSMSNPENFSFVTGGTTGALVPGGTGVFTIRFDPSEAGLQFADVTIRHNDPDGNENPYTFRVQGTGLGEPDIEVFGLPVPLVNDGVPIGNDDSPPRSDNGTAFGRAPVGALAGHPDNTFRIRNSGSAPLDVNVTLDSDQFLLDIPPAASIPPQGFSDFTIRFKPVETGGHRARVTIANNDPSVGASPYTFNISGVGWAPEISVRSARPLDQSIDSGDFTPSPIDGTDLGGSPFPGVIQRTFRISNSGFSTPSPFTGELRIFDITVGNSEVFSIVAGAPVPPIPIIVQEGEIHSFSIRFTPPHEGEFGSMVRIFHNDPDGDESPFIFRVAARAGDPEISLWGGPDLDVEMHEGDVIPSLVNGTDFGEYVIGSIQPPDPPLSHPFRVRNLGGSALTFNISSDSPEFITPGGTTTISANGGYTWHLVFDPTSPGLKEATITILSNDPDDARHTFRVSGLALGPDLEVFGGPALDLPIANPDLTPELADHTDFGSVALRTERTHTFRVANPGNLDLDVAVSFSGEAGDFTTGGLPAVVAPDSSEEFTITFAPTSPGTKTAIITITSNDPEDDPYTFAVQGTAVGAPKEEIMTRFSFSRLQGGGGFSGRMEFQSQPGKTYCITTSTDMITFAPIPGLEGLIGTGDILGVDLSAYVPSETSRTRLFRVEEE